MLTRKLPSDQKDRSRMFNPPHEMMAKWFLEICKQLMQPSLKARERTHESDEYEKGNEVHVP